MYKSYLYTTPKYSLTQEIGVSNNLWSMKLIWVWINTEYNTVEGVRVYPEEFSVWIE